MARREKSAQKKKTGGRSRLARVETAIRRTAKKLTARRRPAIQRDEATPPAKPPRAALGGGRVARPPRPESDIPLDVLNRTYTPAQTSLKASFRASGDDQQRDQELAGGYAAEQWNDEDHFTNKSGDPRIGTHRRKYEPGE